MDRPKPEQCKKTGRFVAGNSGNGGRPKGSKTKLGEVFIADMLAAWEESGQEAITKVIENRPHDFLKVVASLMPKELNVNTSPLEEMDDTELADRLAQLDELISFATSGAESPTHKGSGSA